MAARARYQDDREAGEGFCDVLNGNACQVLEAACCRKLAAHLIKECCPTFARASYASLCAHAGNEACDNQCYGKHDAKRHDILQVGHCQGKARRHEEKVEC